MNSLQKFKPDVGIINAGQAVWRRGYSGSVTPAKLALLLRELDSGQCKNAMEFFDEMEEKDIHLATVMQTRISSAASKLRRVVPASDRAEAKKQAEFVRSVWENLEGRTQIMHDLLTAIGKGFSIAELIYKVVDGLMVIEKINFCPQSLFTFASLEKPEEVLGFPNYLPNGEINGQKLPRQKFIYHTYRASAGGPLRGGLYRGLAWYFLFTNYSMKDWMSFMDIYGIPLRLGKFKPTADEKSREILKKAVYNLGSDAAAVISDDTTIEFIESKLSGSHDLFQNAVEFFNAQKSKRVLGQTLTTEQGKSGSYSLGNIHDMVRRDIVRFDCASLDETLTRDFIIPLVKMNFGEMKSYPSFVTDFDDGSSRMEKLDSLKKLHEMGVPVSLSQVYGAAGISEPAKNDQLLSEVTK